jgi:hypothetical protein
MVEFGHFEKSQESFEKFKYFPSLPYDVDYDYYLSWYSGFEKYCLRDYNKLPDKIIFADNVPNVVFNREFVGYIINNRFYPEKVLPKNYVNEKGVRELQNEYKRKYIINDRKNKLNYAMGNRSNRT